MGKNIFLILILILTTNIYAKFDSNDIENIFYKNNLIPSYISSISCKIPKEIVIQTDNFYSNPYAIFFSTIKNLSKKTKNIKKFTDKIVEMKTYSIIDRLKSELFPYSEKSNPKANAFFYKEHIIGLILINTAIISSVNDKEYISLDLTDAQLEKFFEKDIEITKYDKEIKNLQPEEIIKILIESLNEKNFDKFYSFFSLKFKFQSILKNFIETNNFKYDANNTCFGNLKEISKINLISIKNMTEKNPIIEYAIKVKTNIGEEKTIFLCFNYSQNFGYKIYEAKQE